MAVWFSVTVSEVGDTITSGADIDSPASPLAPGWPGVPASPKNINVVKRSNKNYNVFINDNDCLNFFIIIIILLS